MSSEFAVRQARLSAAQTAARARIRAGEGFIYVAEIVGTGTLKIGFSLDPPRRMADFARNDVRLMGFFPGTLRQERRFHRCLKSRRVGREQFERECYPRSVLVHQGTLAELRAEHALGWDQDRRATS